MKRKGVKNMEKRKSKRAVVPTKSVNAMTNREFAEFVYAEVDRRNSDESEGYHVTVALLGKDNELVGGMLGHLSKAHHAQVVLETLTGWTDRGNPLKELGFLR